MLARKPVPKATLYLTEEDRQALAHVARELGMKDLKHPASPNVSALIRAVARGDVFLFDKKGQPHPVPGHDPQPVIEKIIDNYEYGDGANA